MANDLVAQAIEDAFTSPNESDRNGEVANVVDGLFYMARTLKWLGNGDAATPMGAIEAHGLAVLDSGGKIADALSGIADAIDRLAAAVEAMKS